MREIKFRAWSIDEKLMFDIAFPSWNGSVEVWKNNKPQTETVFYSQNGPEEQAILMQFTGLKDKNGKEIYDGDIFTYCFDTWYLFWQETFCRFSAMPTNGRLHTLPLEIKYTDNIEVIGNIYKNPELL